MSGQLTSVNLVSSDTTAQFTPGTLHVDNLGNRYRYVKAVAAAVLQELSIIDDSFNLQALITTSLAGSAANFSLGCGLFAIAIGSYGFVQTSGVFQIIAAGAMVANAKAQTTTTPGQIDDATTVTIVGLSAYNTVAGSGKAQFYSANDIYTLS